MTPMSLEEMQEFVDKVSPDKVVVTKVEDNYLEPYAGYTYRDEEGKGNILFSDAIYLSFTGSRTSKAFVKAFLLHELGHLYTEESELPYINEYNAHMWGIKKSLELND